jgi:hypothetical protein
VSSWLALPSPSGRGDRQEEVSSGIRRSGVWRHTGKRVVLTLSEALNRR